MTVLATQYLKDNPQDIFVQEENFTLRPEQRAFVNRRLEVIQNSAPAFSTLHFKIHQHPQSFSAQLTIYASSQRFRSQQKQSHLNHLMSAIERDIQQQLRRWKKSRPFTKNGFTT